MVWHSFEPEYADTVMYYLHSWQDSFSLQFSSLDFDIGIVEHRWQSRCRAVNSLLKSSNRADIHIRQCLYAFCRTPPHPPLQIVVMHHFCCCHKWALANGSRASHSNVSLKDGEGRLYCSPATQNPFPPLGDNESTISNRLSLKHQAPSRWEWPSGVKRWKTG